MPRSRAPHHPRFAASEDTRRKYNVQTTPQRKPWAHQTSAADDARGRTAGFCSSKRALGVGVSPRLKSVVKIDEVFAKPSAARGELRLTSLTAQHDHARRSPLLTSPQKDAPTLHASEKFVRFARASSIRSSKSMRFAATRSLIQGRERVLIGGLIDLSR